MTARRFELHRDDDVTGVSGTGVVAEGIEFTDRRRGAALAQPVAVVGRVPRAWAWSRSSAVHGHGGQTRIVWLDE